MSIKDIYGMLECMKYSGELSESAYNTIRYAVSQLPDVVLCKECKRNQKKTAFWCPLSMHGDQFRPDEAWCWKGERDEHIEGKSPV